MKTETTLALERAIWRTTNKMGTFGCFEVTIGWFGKERVDYMTYDTKGEFKCYEIKVSKADFNSGCHNSFVGNLNYYVMPPELYEQVKDDIPDWVGVYTTPNDRSASSVKRAKRRELAVDKDMLKDSLIRSLYRESTKLIKSEDPCIIDRLHREINRLRRERDEYYRAYWDLKRIIEQD